MTENLGNTKLAVSYFGSNENLEILRNLSTKLSLVNAPEPLKSAVAIVKGEVGFLIDTIETKSTDEIEDYLKKLSIELEISLIATASDDERARIIEVTKLEYEHFKYKPEVLQKIMLRKLYEKFQLPALTLFAF